MTTSGATRTSSCASPWRCRQIVERWGWRAVAGLLFAPTCALCGRPLERPGWVCRECVRALPTLRPPRCAVCGARLDDQSVDLCRLCGTRDRGFEAARALGPYASGWGRLLRALKFGGERAIAVPLGRLLADNLRGSPLLDGPEVVTYVPMTSGERRRRGFNQSRLLARRTACELGLPTARLLQKRRRTRPQTGLSGGDRRRNLQGAFRAVPGRGDGAVLLIDDVYTTGATASECSRALRDGGWDRVTVLTVARST